MGYGGLRCHSSGVGLRACVDVRCGFDGDMSIGSRNVFSSSGFVGIAPQASGGSRRRHPSRFLNVSSVLHVPGELNSIVNAIGNVISIVVDYVLEMPLLVV